MKTFYLPLIFSVFLKNCRCKNCNYSGSDCGNGQFLYDIYKYPGYPDKFCSCQQETDFQMNSYCTTGKCSADVNCENVWSFLRNNNINKNEYACPILDTEQYLCVYKDQNVGCEAKYCSSLNKNDCKKLNYCVVDGDSCKVNDCRGFYTKNDCTSINLNGNVTYCIWEDNSCKERLFCTNINADSR